MRSQLARRRKRSQAHALARELTSLCAPRSPLSPYAPAPLQEAKAARAAGAELAAGGGAAALFDFSGYSRFCSLIGPPEATRPKDRTKVEDHTGKGGERTSHSAWLMRLIEEVYDARYAKDTNDLKEVEGGAGAAAGADAAQSPFPNFVVEFFTKRFGLRSLIDQVRRREPHCP